MAMICILFVQFEKVDKSAIEEEKIVLKEVNKKLVDIEKDITKARDEHNKYLKELGLDLI